MEVPRYKAEAGVVSQQNVGCDKRQPVLSLRGFAV